MANAVLDSLMDYLRLNLPGALDGAIELELSNVLEEFFDKSNAWIERVSVRTVSGRKTYLVQAPSGVINRLVYVSTSDGNAMPIPASMADGETLQLRDDPGASLVYWAYFSIRQNPGEALDVIPEWVYNKFRLSIIHGTLARMMAQLAKPYSSERLAIFNGRKFQSNISQARAEASQQFLYRGQVWEYPRNFVGGGSQR